MRFQYRCLVLVLAVANGLTAPSGDAVCADGPAQIDAREFAKLPVRYNGRVKPLLEFAVSIRAYFTGNTCVASSAAAKVEAVRWFLDVASGHERESKYPTFRLPAEILKQAGIKPHPDHPDRVSTSVLREHSKQLDELRDKVALKGEDEQSSAERQFLELFGRVSRYHKFQQSMMSPNGLEGEQLFRVARLSREVDGNGDGDAWIIPRLIPPNSTNSHWRSLVAANVEHFAATQLKSENFKPQPFAVDLTSALISWGTNNGDAFARHVKSARERIGPMATLSPVTFDVPCGWIEAGVSEPYKLHHFSDTYEWGFSVASLERRTEDAYVLIYINHFPNVAIDEYTAVNSWRIIEGLAPLSRPELKPTLHKTRIGSHDFVAVDIEAPSSLPVYNRRVVSRILKHETGSWVLSLYGRREHVKDSMADFDSFVGSFELGTSKDVRTWLGVEGPADSRSVPTEGLNAVGLVLREGKRAWTIRLTGTPESVEKQREKVVQFANSLRAKHPNQRLKSLNQIEYDLPKSWKHDDTTAGTLSFTIDDAPDAFVMAQVLGEPGVVPSLAVANHWRKMWQLDPLSASAFAKSATFVDIRGKKRPIIEVIATKPVDADLGKGEETGVFEFTPPEQWHLDKENKFAVAKFTVGKSKGTVVSVTRLPAASASSLEQINNNINRWRAQVGLNAIPLAQQRGNIQSIKLAGRQSVFVRIDGDRKSIAAVIAVRGDLAWFIKLHGPNDEMRAEMERFRKFLKSARFVLDGDKSEKTKDISK